MAVELTANAVQAVPAGQNVLFTDAPVKCGRGYVVHREGAGLVTLRGICNGCSPIARYRVLFVGNISVPTGGTAGAISVALALGGEALPTTTATATPAAVGDAFNVDLRVCGCSPWVLRSVIRAQCLRAGNRCCQRQSDD